VAVHITTVFVTFWQFEIIPYLCCQTACWLHCSFIDMKEKVAIFFK